MALQASEFDLARLSREARVAGEAFGFEEVEGEMTEAQTNGALVWWLSATVAITALLGWSLL